MNRFHKIATAIILASSVTATSLAQTPEQQEFLTAYKGYQAAIEKSDDSAAKPHAKTAYMLGKKLFGTSHKNTAALALNYARLIDGEEKETVLKDAVSLYQSAYGAEAPEALDPMIDLADTLSAHGKQSEAKEAYTNALSLLEKQPKANPVTEGGVLVELGRLQMTEEAQNEALATLEKAADKLKNQKGDRAEFQRAKANLWLGQVSVAKADYKQAINLLKDALKDFHRSKTESPLVLENHAYLAKAYAAEGNEKKASKHCSKLKSDNKGKELIAKLNLCAA